MANTRSKKPFQGVTDFFSEMSRMSAVMHGRGSEDHPRTETTAWAPITDIHASGKDLVIRCELPGVNRDDITIDRAGDVLTISGDRETAEQPYYVRERFFGAFRRVISLPDGVDDEDISADFHNGLLVITAAGAATTIEPKQIGISSDGN